MVEFWSGLSTGLVSSLILFVLRYGIGKFLGFIPGLSSRVIRGTWETTFWKDNQPFKEQAELSQFLNWVWGEINYSERGRKYKLRGTLRSGVLVATYEPIGRKDTVDRGAFTLFLNRVGDVTRMEGKYSWTDNKTQLPEADKYEWIKNK